LTKINFFFGQFSQKNGRRPSKRLWPSQNGFFISQKAGAYIKKSRLAGIAEGREMPCLHFAAT
jgi:hypothetical protein